MARLISLRAWLTVSCAVVVFSILSSIADAQCPDSVMGVWTFEEGEGSIAADASGLGNDAELVNMEDPWVSPENPSLPASQFALQFDGEDDIVSAPSEWRMDENFTMMCWVKSDGGFGHLLGKTFAEEGLYADGAKSLFIDDEGTVVFDIWGVDQFPGDTPVNDNVWHHVALSQEDGVQTIYVDGVEEASEAIFVTDDADTVLTLGFSREGGFDDPEEDFPGVFQGVIDDVAIFQAVLTAAEIEEVLLGGCSGPPVECPQAGDPDFADTTCDGPVEVSGPTDDEGQNIPGLYTITVNGANDASGDVISYSLVAENADGGDITARQRENEVFEIVLPVGTWTITVTVDDRVGCDDAAENNSCVAGPFEVVPRVFEGITIGGDDWVLGNLHDLGPIGNPPELLTTDDGVPSLSFFELPDDNAFLTFNLNVTSLPVGQDRFPVAVLARRIDEDAIGFAIKNLSIDPAVDEDGCQQSFIATTLGPDGRVATDETLVSDPVGEVVEVFDPYEPTTSVLPEFLETFGATLELQMGENLLRFDSAYPEDLLSEECGYAQGAQIFQVSFIGEDLEGELLPKECTDPPDTHCAGMTIEGPDGTNLEGNWTVTIDGTDDGGDTPIIYTVVAESETGDTVEATQVGNNAVPIRLRAGTWVITGSVDDDSLCDDAADGDSCHSDPIEVERAGPVQIGQWCFEEGSGDVVGDSVGDNDGTLLPGDGDAPPTWAPGRGGDSLWALEFEKGPSDRAVLIEEIDGLFDFDYTWTAWVNTTESGVILSTGPGGEGEEPGTPVLFTEGEDEPFLFLDVLEVDFDFCESDAFIIADGEWHMIALTVEANVAGDDDLIVLYVDGEACTQTSFDLHELGPPVGSFMAGYANEAYPDEYGGLIDNVTAWSSALSEEEIFELFELPEDACEPPVVGGGEFLRGDDDASGVVDVTDPIVSLNFQFLGSFVPTCLDALDTDDSGVIDVTDPIYNLGFQFLGNPPPPAPGPAICAADPTADDLDCESHQACD